MTADALALLTMLLEANTCPSDKHSHTDGAIAELEALGLQTTRDENGELVLSKPPHVLNPDRLARGLAEAASLPVATLSYQMSTGSTNADALAAPAPAPGGCAIFLAEHQSAGQGRRGKPWRSPFASGLCISLAFRLPVGSDLARLPLALGIGIRRALMGLGLTHAQLKWPNDLVVAGRKLGGILLSARQLPEGDTLVVAGVGLNVHAAPPKDDQRALEPISLAQCLECAHADRTTVAIALINAMRQAAQEYSRTGFASFATDWPEADYLRQRSVCVLEDSGESIGEARGIDEKGRLLLATAEGIVALSSGEISVRAMGEP